MKPAFLLAFAAASLLSLAQENPQPPERRVGGGGGGPMRSLTMRILDADRDGALSAMEIQQAGAKFGKLDANQDGKLTEGETRPAFAPPGGAGGRPEDAVARFMQFDRNGDGVLQKDEVPERMQGMIARADANQDGALSREEVSRMTPPGGRGRGGAGMGMMRMDPVLRALDSDEDGEISTAEWNAAPQALAKLDKNGDGQLTPDELRSDFPGGEGRRRQGRPGRDR